MNFKFQYKCGYERISQIGAFKFRIKNEGTTGMCEENLIKLGKEFEQKFGNIIEMKTKLQRIQINTKMSPSTV